MWNLSSDVSVGSSKKLSWCVMKTSRRTERSTGFRNASDAPQLVRSTRTYSTMLHASSTRSSS